MTTKRVDDYYAQLTIERGLSPATIRHVHAVLRDAFGQAVRWGMVPMNPFVGARRGEVCGLRWSDIDRGVRTLSITRAIASVAHRPLHTASGL